MVNASAALRRDQQRQGGDVMDSRDEHVANPTRRDIITTASAAGLVAAIDAIVGSSQAQSGKPPHVVIVGAGLAGLCAAYLLQQRGWSYTILEAERAHVGGRVCTRPIGTQLFGNKFYWEAGAMRIPHNHDITLKYINKFPELKTRTFVMDNPKAFYFARGHRERAENERNLRRVFNLTRSERNMSPGDLWKLSVHGPRDRLLRKEKDELRSGNSFTHQSLKNLDRLSLRQLIERAHIQGENAPLSDEAIEYILFGYGNLTLQHGASTEFLREELNEVWDPPFFEIVGGMAALPKAFQSRLRSEQLKMGCEVTRLVDRAGDRPKAFYRKDDAEHSEEGDFLLCTVPFPVLSRIEFDPVLPHKKQRAIVEMGFDSATKVVFLTKSRFWESKDGIYGGSSTTDLMTGPIIYPSDNAEEKDRGISEGPGVLIASYAWGQDARRLGAMRAKEREAFALNQAKQVHPELGQDGMVIDQASWTWDSYPWAGGAFAFYQPGQFTRIHRHVVAPVGRIHFAGEQCSRSHSWMQGALESAETAVDALVTQHGANR
jgi:monoamine oxidase